jgi:hypothetical protein
VKSFRSFASEISGRLGAVRDIIPDRCEIIRLVALINGILLVDENQQSLFRSFLKGNRPVSVSGAGYPSLSTVSPVQAGLVRILARRAVVRRGFLLPAAFGFSTDICPPDWSKKPRVQKSFGPLTIQKNSRSA